MHAYDPSWRALLFPSAATDFFAGGRPASETALCAELARIAYIPFEREAGARRASEILRRAGFARERFISAGGTECFVARDVEARLTVVAFRGTAGLRDIVTDLMAWRTRWAPGGKVHAGFACALRRVWPTLVLSLGEREGRLVYTGHSLGGALATLAATLVPPDALYTFGSPRVGDSAFARLLERIDPTRITGCADLVCAVPPDWLGFSHVGTMSYLDRNGQVHRGPPQELTREDAAIARREYRRSLAWRWGNVWTRRLADHAPANYLSAIAATAAQGSEPGPGGGEH
jgi:hypothetical protein